MNKKSEKEKMKSPDFERDMYLVINDYDKFYEEHCSDCTLGDHGGCGQCSYGNMITATREERGRKEFSEEISDLINESEFKGDVKKAPENNDYVIVDKNQLIEKLYEKFEEQKFF
ncbi:MAG: hypothetical protein ABIB43_01775 [archaeon]